MQSYRISAKEAKERLIAGNQKYVEMNELSTDVSPTNLLRSCKNGQQPYAIIVTCSDSRVVTELRRYRRPFRYKSCRKRYRLPPARQYRVRR